MNETEAYEAGYAAGTARASGAFDGNTSDETYAAFLKGWDDGDPEVMDAYDPQFSIGEWAGESASELGIEGFEDAYLDGFGAGYWDEIVSVAKYHVNHASDAS